MEARSRQRGRFRRPLWMTIVLVFLGAPVRPLTSADDATQSRPATSPDVITVDVQMSQFVQRRRLSAERVGVLKFTPAEGDRVEAGEIVARLRDEVPKAMLAAAEARAASTVDIEAAEKYAESETFEYQVMVAANRNRPEKPTYTGSDVERAKLRAESATLQGAVKRHERHVNGLMADQARAEGKTFEI